MERVRLQIRRELTQKFMGRERRQLYGRLLVLGLLLWVSGAAAQPGSTAQLLTVSKPPASLLPTDPAQGLVYTSPTDLASAKVFFSAEGGPMGLVYLVFDSGGTGYLTFDDGPDETAPGGVMIIDDLQTRKDLTFDAARDSLITGSAAGMSEPKDLFLIEDLGFLVVADFANADIKVFDTLSFGDVPPLFATDKLGSSLSSEPRRPWGVAYDEAADRLFVGATDGALLVYDRFLEARGESGPDRVVTPTWQGEPVSSNLHELIYLPENDRIVVTDVGAATTTDQPGFDSDGALLVIDNASRADGATDVGLRIYGPASLLGNPVSLVKRGDDMFVAENGLDLLLRFDGLLNHRGALDLSPDAAVSLVKPESVVLLPAP